MAASADPVASIVPDTLRRLAGGLLPRRRRVMIRSRDEAVAAAASALPGFAATDALVSADGRAALAIDGHGRTVVLAVRGRRVTARDISWSALRATEEGLVLEDAGVTLRDVDALDARRLLAA